MLVVSIFKISWSVVDESRIVSFAANVPLADVNKSFFAVPTKVSPVVLAVKIPVPLI